jgi:hypothetical protein
VVRHSGLAVVSLPCIVLAALSAWWTIGRAAGDGLWPPDTVTLAEAVATRNNAEALRLIARGADPNRRERVRGGLLVDGRDVVVSPLEAAVGAQRAEALRMLLANGATLDDHELRVLRCYERTRADSGVREILESRDRGPLDCSGVTLPIDRAPS